MKLAAVVMLALLSGCAAIQGSTAPTPVSTAPTQPTTMDIIAAAAAAAPEGVVGEYQLSIQAAGTDGRAIYLNTELDYRDQRNITIAMSPAVAAALAGTDAASAQQYFVGKKLLVKGKAHRMKIDFMSQGKPTGLYYYQTHIRVYNPAQITLLTDKPA